MGCHTWFSVPILTDKEEILKIAQQHLNGSKNWFSESTKKMYQLAIDNQLVDPCCDLAECTFSDAHVSQRKEGEWSIYMDISDYSLMQYNKINNTNIKKYSPESRELILESYSDEPRIGGYPEVVISSYEEMVDFVEKGFEGTSYENGEIVPYHYDFYFSGEQRWKAGQAIDNGVNKEYRGGVMNGIKQFFINHPKGVITFG